MGFVCEKLDANKLPPTPPRHSVEEGILVDDPGDS